MVSIETFFSGTTYFYHTAASKLSTFYGYKIMKKLCTIFVLAVCLLGLQSQALYSQGLQIVDAPPTILTASTNEAYISHYVYVKNTDFTSKVLMVERTINELAPEHSTVFCFAGECYLPERNISKEYELKGGATTPQTFALNPKLEDIYGHPGTSKITYTIYDRDNPSDKITIQFTYVVTATTDIRPGFDGAPVTILSNSFPSPAFDNARIDYNIGQTYSNASLTVYNLIGNQMQTVRLDAPKGSVNIPTATMNAGVYFYSIVVDGKKIVTKKLIVKH